MLRFYYFWGLLGLTISVGAHIALYFTDLGGFQDFFALLFWAGILTANIGILVPRLAIVDERALLGNAPLRRSAWPEIALGAAPFVYLLALAIIYLLSNFVSGPPRAFAVATGWNSGAFVVTSLSAMFYFSAFDTARYLLEPLRVRRIFPLLRVWREEY